MRVTPIAHTLMDWSNVRKVIPDTRYAAEAPEEFPDVTDADHLGEFSGRACYKAWERKNPATSTNSGYLANILDRQHFSVLEHASVTFYVEDVSRALLVELERHRFLSFSVESQRYVDQSASHQLPVIPPALADMPASGPWTDLVQHYADSINYYNSAVDYLLAAGYSRKEAREAARAFLPNATPVDLVVTGNLRAWRDVLSKRYHGEADAEIRAFATEILGHLRELAPNSFQDFPSTPIKEAQH